ncbi:MAG: hypothetical protein H6739_16405 [Alphaproteobacteria bacterium]|nr:hypothetical protein [Alphaproteobacteria bacterium]
MLLLAWLLPLLGCGNAGSSVDDAHAYAEALRLADQDPEAAIERCGDLSDPDMQASCVWSMAENLGDERPHLTEALCETLTGYERDECFFGLARAQQDLGPCAKAGRFQPHCERHLFIPQLRAWLGRKPVPGAFETDVQASLTRFALEPYHRQTWMDLYRVALHDIHPVSKAHCAPVADPRLRRYCLEVVKEQHDHYLENALSKGELPCEGPLPHRFQDDDLPGLEERMKVWRAEGRCGDITAGATP